jgi:NADH-quinone oxidoreductase subunit J
MLTFYTLVIFFSSLSFVSSSLVITSKNPVYSVLFLILSFVNVTALLLLLNLEFLPITFIVVYVGAIAVLFLFVLMTLNIKLAEVKQDRYQSAPLGIVITGVFLFTIALLLRSDIEPLVISLVHNELICDYTNQQSVLLSSLFHHNEHNIRSIGLILFTTYSFQFLIIGFILLFAMIGTIVLTLYKKFQSRNQAVYFQILRDFNTALSFYS